MHSPKTQRAHSMRPTVKHYYLNIAKTKLSARASKQGQRSCVCPFFVRAAAAACKADRAHSTRLSARQRDWLAGWHEVHSPHTLHERQAVRSLGPLGCACYQASTRGLSTSCSGWDLNCLSDSGKLHLGGGFALRCFQRLSFLHVAIQLWPRQANWHTSGAAIPVLSYWR